MEQLGHGTNNPLGDNKLDQLEAARMQIMERRSLLFSSHPSPDRQVTELVLPKFSMPIDGR